MNKKSLWIVGGIVVVAAIVLVAMGGGNKNKEQGSEESSGQEAAIDKNAPKSLKELMAIDKPQKCEYQDQTEDGSSYGTVYIEEGRMSGDFTVETAQGVFVSHMIAKDSEIYMWEDSTGTAYKTTVQNISQDQEGETAKPVDIDKEFNYHCENWSVDSSKFELPQGKEFTDLSAMMEAAAQMQAGEGESLEPASGSEDLKAAQCAACQQVPEETRAQCLQALGCN